MIKGTRTIYIDGGKTIQSLLERNLIDEMTITRIPVVLGEGISLFKPQSLKIGFTHVETEVFENGLIKSNYRKS